MTLKLGMQHRVLKYYQVCLNDDPGLTLTYFTARSNLVPYVFVWEKYKTGFFRNYKLVHVVAVNLMSTWTYMNIKGQGHLLTLVQGHSFTTYSNIFSLETARPIEAKFQMEPP